MVGTDGSGNQIGVAPGAKWIACNAFNNSGQGVGVFACGEFMLAPTDLVGNNPNPSMRPHVVNNSWGNCDLSYYDWYEGTIDAWIAAGIYPIFANGNASNCGYSYPPGLNTVGNPARSYHVTAVGSTGTNNGTYATHSNWGPTDSLDTINGSGYPNIKPQVDKWVLTSGRSVIVLAEGRLVRYGIRILGQLVRKRVALCPLPAVCQGRKNCVGCTGRH